MMTKTNDNTTTLEQPELDFNNPHRLRVVEGEHAEAGVITYFRFSGEVDRAALFTAAESVSLETGRLPKLPGPDVALRRAVDAQRDKHRLVRSNEDGEYCIVDEIVSGKSLEYITVLRCGLGPDKSLLTDLDERTAADDTRLSFSKELADKVAAEFARAQTVYATVDISQWLTKSMRRLQAVTLRDTGGVYFVPRSSLTEFKKIVATLRRCSRHTLFEIPAMHSDETVKAVLDALLDEATTAVAKVEAELDEMADSAGSKGLGKRALNTRVASLDALKRKLASYEELLGVRLETIGAQLQDVRASVTLAILAAEAEDATSA
jgi:hypothetical protein